MAADRLRYLAEKFPAVVILGPRQIGKTTLARQVFSHLPYVDLEEPRTRELFQEDATFQLEQRAKNGIVLDEAQAVPAVFSALRGLIDRDRHHNGRFIVLGSVQPAMVRGVSESLAGRAGLLELEGLTAVEAASAAAPFPVDELWLRGGFPDALQGDFRQWHEPYLRLLIERDLPQLGIAADPLFVRRLLTMLAHQQGGLLNVQSLCNALDVSHAKITRLLDIFEQTFLLRRLQPWFANVGKRLTKAPKVYLRDTGMLHHLLGIGTLAQLDSHPIRGESWESFVINDLLAREHLVHPHSQAYFWRTAVGAEIDLLLDRGDQMLAVEIKAGRGNRNQARHLGDALADVKAQHGWIADQGEGEEALTPLVSRIGFGEIAKRTAF